jgi:hypothetical protein
MVLRSCARFQHVVSFRICDGKLICRKGNRRGLGVWRVLCFIHIIVERMEETYFEREFSESCRNRDVEWLEGKLNR